MLRLVWRLEMKHSSAMAWTHYPLYRLFQYLPTQLTLFPGNSTGILKLQIAENYCSSSDEDDKSPRKPHAHAAAAAASHQARAALRGAHGSSASTVVSGVRNPNGLLATEALLKSNSRDRHFQAMQQQQQFAQQHQQRGRAQDPRMGTSYLDLVLDVLLLLESTFCNACILENDFSLLNNCS